MGRRPETAESLRLIQKTCEFSFTHIIDIGVQYKTGYLIEACPDLKHILVEPCGIHADVISKNYSHIDYELFHVAASGSDHKMYLHDIANDELRPDIVTHSYVSLSQHSPNPRLVNTTEINALTVDSIIEMARLPMDQDNKYLVKIDVDGIEEDIMKGMRKCLQSVGILIVEAALSSVSSKIEIASALGFDLLDITDHGYYYDILTQVELIFASKSLKDSYAFLDPWKATNGVLHASKWQHV